MASLEQLEKQKQELITSYTQIVKDTSIPSNDKVQIMKDLSRAIANITDQINSMISGTLPKTTGKKKRKLRILFVRKKLNR
jgi:hypothetical protein